jgi:hypothetical protein
MVSGGTKTNDGLNIIMDRTYNSSPTRSVPSEYKVGTGTTTAAATDTDLEEAKPITGTEVMDECDATTGWSDSADASAADTDTSNKVDGTASLKLGKDGTASVSFSYDKTVTSVDGTSKTLYARVRIADSATLNKLASSNAMTVRLGSDSSNYYEKQYDRADLTASSTIFSNTVEVAISAGFDSTTGSPVIGSLDYFYIGFETNASGDTITSGLINIDLIDVASSDDYTDSFDTGFPSIDTSTKVVSTECTLTSVQSNGFAISEFGMFNTDGTALLDSRDVFNAIDKNDTTEIVFIVKDEFVLLET